MISYTLRASAFLFLQKPFFSLSFWSSELHQYSHYTFQTTCRSLPTIKGKSVFLPDQTCSLCPMASSFSSVSEQNGPMSMVTQDLNRTQRKSPLKNILRLGILSFSTCYNKPNMRDCNQRSANIQKSHHVHEIQLEMRAFRLPGIGITRYILFSVMHNRYVYFYIGELRRQQETLLNDNTALKNNK